MASLKKQLRKHDLEIILWDDHAGPYQDIPAADVHTVVRCTVGWVLFEDDRRVVIASTLDDGNKSGSDMNALGKGMILARQVIG
jgi:hypothetical protein